MSDETKSNGMKEGPVATDPAFDRRSAQAMVATFLQMGRSVHLARWLHQARQRSLEKRVREAKDMTDIVALQQRLDAQQSQAAVVEQAAERFRNRAHELAEFAKAGLTMDDFNRMGVEHVVDMDRFTAAMAQVQRDRVGTATDSPRAEPPEALHKSRATATDPSKKRASQTKRAPRHKA